MEATEVLEPVATVEETGTTDAAVSEAPEVQSVAGDEPAVTTETETPARPRDAQGRFLKKDGSPVAPDEQAALAAAATSPATPTTPPATKPVVVPAGEPFVFRADGQKIPIPGALLSADGALTIPANQVPAMRQLLAEGMAHRGSWRTKEADYQRQISESSATETARAEKYNSAAIMLYDRIMDDEWLIALAQDPVRQREYLKKELGFALKEADLNAPRASAKPAQPAAAQDDAQLEAAFAGALSEEVDDLLDDPQVKALFSPEDRKDVQAAFAARMAAFAAMVDGDLKLDLSKLKAEFAREVTMQKKIKQAAVDAKKAKDFNDARNKPATGAPVVSTKGPASTGTSSGRVFKTKEEYQKAMGLH